MKIATAVLALIVSACGHRSDIDELALAVRAGDIGRTTALLRRGADPNHPSGVNDWTPLLHAVHKNQLATAAILLEHGTDPDRGVPGGTTPLMMAAAYGNDRMMSLLLRHGADPHLRNGDGRSALDLALTGVPDIDAFTLFRCQDSTAAMLSSLHVTARVSSRVWARAKRCSS